MRTNYDKNLANQAKVKLLAEKFNNPINQIHRNLDSKGNVIRDYKRELAILVEDENDTLLPSVDISCFDGFRNMKKYREDNANISPIVDTVKLAPLPETPKNQNVIQQFISVINSILNKTLPPTKEQLCQPSYNKKGWIYPYIISNAKRRKSVTKKIQVS